jgi:glycosyltransferase involved in cell wall biosynthesis
VGLNSQVEMTGKSGQFPESPHASGDGLGRYSKPFVSVVIPAYNCAQYIAQAVQSVLDQSFASYEIIIVNDGSPDTEALEAALASFRSRIVYVKQSSKGPAGARNTGILRAQGKYVAFLDGDDYWSREHLAKQIDMLERQSGLELAYCDCQLIKDEKPFTRAFQLQPQAQFVSFESLLSEDSAISTSSTVVSRAAILAAGLFDEGFLRCEDFDLWLRMSFAGVRMDYHPDAEVYHRINSVGLSANRTAMIQDLIRVYQKTATQLRLTRRQLDIIGEMVRRAEAEYSVEKLKDSLEKKDFEQARSAADRALALKKNWKLKVSALALRTAPRAFRFFHLGRAFLLGRKPFVRRPASSPPPVVEVSSEEHPSPLVHQ